MGAPLCRLQPGEAHHPVKGEGKPTRTRRSITSRRASTSLVQTGLAEAGSTFDDARRELVFRLKDYAREKRAAAMDGVPLGYSSGHCS